MSTVTLPNIRVSSDLTVGVVLKDDGVAIDWSTLSNIKAYLYADAQRAMAGRCTVSIDETDSTRLVCAYRANKPQYIGVNRIVITCTYRGETKTYDKPALNFVRWTDDQAGQQITIDDPDVDVEIEVEDVSSSLLDQAIAAALAAAAAAEHAAHLIPNQVLLDAEAATAAANAAADAANAAGITSAQVSIADNEPGTPSAEVSLVNKVLSIIFHHLKGNTGDAAGFGTITATVDDVVGDPSVTVTATGPDTAKNFTFAFHGLRGIQGVPGVANAKYKQVDSLPTASAATMDYIYLTPSGTTGVYNMSYTEQDGSSYSWQDLGTTAIQLSDYATKAEVSQLEAEVDYYMQGDIDISDLPAQTMYPNGANWLVNTNYKCKFYPCTPGMTYTIKANNNYYCNATFVKAIGTANGQPVDYATGYSDMVGIVTNTSLDFVAPSDAVYLVIEVLGGGNDRTPAYVKQISIPQDVDTLKTNVANLMVNVNSLLIEQKPSVERGLYVKADGTFAPSTNDIMRLSECLNIPTVDCKILHLWQDAPTYGYGIVFLDANYNFVGNLDIGSNGTNVTFDWDTDDVIVPASAKYIMLQSQNREPIVYSSEILLTAINPQAFIRERELFLPQNLLYGKKWVACGDSWTAGDFTGYVDSQGHTGTESDAYDPVMGMYKTYPWWIAKRNGINLINEAVAGTTMTTKVANSFSDVRYANVPLDADYITLMFGLNETTQSPGTSGSTDKSTLWGAWNFSLNYLMTYIPRAKIGVIIPDGWMAGDSAQTCRETMIAVAKAWGIPYLDLTGDPHISLGVGGRISSLDLKTSAKILRDSQYKLENNHPNLLAHEMRSTYIEAFLRSL